MSQEIIEFIIADIIEFHNELETVFRVSSGIRQMTLLESAVNLPFQTFDGNDLYPTIYDKAAKLCVGICNNHPFIDGNKRTALHTMFIFLSVQGIEFSYTDIEMEDIIVRIASREMSSVELSIWLRNKSESQ